MTSQDPTPEPKKAPSHRKTAAQLVGVVVFMGAMAWAAVPLYDWFCRVTGYAGTTMVADGASDTVLDETIRVRFDANVSPSLDWQFRPSQTEMTLKIGQDAMAYYEAVNLTDEVLVGTASYNVAPDIAGYYFNKIECFCFTEQVLQPGERVLMPVQYFVDPDIVNDRDAGNVRMITLSYTFHPTARPSATAQAALDAGPQALVN
ncbi:MAG: cytochrome c oxidase assembly protein [Paracoccus sp. (in: a-proteobacteria)]|nr:cytochrome c oxidase assembly protein [Paracoccus sp. (in: a-proteobacteria)]